MLKSFFTNTFLFAIGPQLPRLLGFILLPFITKYLTSVDYAIWGISTSYIAALSGLRNLGMEQVLVNSFFRNKYGDRWKIIWRRILGALLLWGIPYIILLSAVVYFALRNKVGENINSILLLVCIQSVFLELITMYGFKFFQLSQKPLTATIAIVISGFFGVVAQYFFIVDLKLHYLGFFYSSFIASFVGAFIFLFYFFVKHNLVPFFSLKFKKLKIYLRVSLPTIPHNYSSFLLTASDRVILDFYKVPLSKIGEYNFAYIFGSLADTLGGAIGMSISPVYLKLYAKNTDSALYYTKILTVALQIVFISGAFIAAVWMKEVFMLLTKNKELQMAYPIAVLLVMNFTYRPMYWASVNLLGYKEETSQLWKISFISGIMNVVINLLLVPYFDVYGSIIGTFIALLYMGFSGFFLKAFKKHCSLNYHPWYFIILIIASTLCAYLIKDSSLLIKGVITFIVFLSLLIIFKKSSKQIKQIQFALTTE